MKKIILRNEYHWCKENEYIEVSDEIAELFAQFKRNEKTYIEKLRYHKAFYSLDEDNGIEKSIIFVSATPDELYEKKLNNEELYKAISMLPEIQARRIYAHFFQNMSMTKIGRIEGVSKMAISKSIESGLKKIKKILKSGFTKA